MPYAPLKKKKKKDFAAVVCFKWAYFWRILAAWTSGAFRVLKIFESHKTALVIMQTNTEFGSGCYDDTFVPYQAKH